MNKTNALALALVAALAAGCTLTLDAEKYAPKSAADCGPNQKVCGYKCVAKDDPATGCGGESCQPCQGDVNAIAVCGDGGTCATQCNLGWGNCDAGAGCETRLDGSPPTLYCGGCGRYAVAGTSCSSAGYVKPATVAVSGTPGDVYLDGDSTPNRVYYVDSSGGGTLWKTDVTLLAPSQPLMTGIGEVSCVYGDATRVVYCAGNTSGAGPTSLLSLSPPSAPPVGSPSTLATTSAAGTPRSVLTVSRATPWKAWWLTPGGDDLRVISLDPAMAEESAPYTLPKVGAFRGLAYEYYMGIYVADEALGGRVRALDLSVTFNSSPEVGTGFGAIGAVAGRMDSASSTQAEFYVADLATGSVYRQNVVDRTRRSRIYAGAGPTPRMHMVADDKGVLWSNAGAGTVLEYVPATGQIITRYVGGSPEQVSMSAQSVVWIDSNTRELAVVAR